MDDGLSGTYKAVSDLHIDAKKTFEKGSYKWAFATILMATNWTLVDIAKAIREQTQFQKNEVEGAINLRRNLVP